MSQKARAFAVLTRTSVTYNNNGDDADVDADADGSVAEVVVDEDGCGDDGGVDAEVTDAAFFFSPFAFHLCAGVGAAGAGPGGVLCTDSESLTGPFIVFVDAAFAGAAGVADGDRVG